MYHGVPVWIKVKKYQTYPDVSTFDPKASLTFHNEVLQKECFKNLRLLI